MRLHFVIQTNLVHDLIVFIDQIQLLGHALFALKTTLSKRKQTLNHELHALVDFALVQNPSEAFKNPMQTLRSELLERETTLLDERDRNLHAVVRRRAE